MQVHVKADFTRRADTHSCVYSQRLAFTLLELVVTVAVVATMLLILLPSLKSAREVARQGVCLGQTRSATMVILSSCVDNQDAWPNAGEVEREVVMPDGTTTRLGGRRGLSNGRWALMFPEHWSGAVWDRSLRCPRQPRAGAGPVATVLPLLWMSSVMWLNPATIEAGHEERAAWMRTRVADVLFPSHKSVLFEQAAFCVEAPGAAAWLRMGQTPYWPVSVATADGAARRRVRAEGLPSAWTMPFDATLQGVRGRDLRD
jgi:type II secretory pathway pseudopilin PulG